jgi:hypothetical protein
MEGNREPWGYAMTTFDDRENAFENKFAHDADMQFRAEARRNKLVGLWAAGLLGKSGDAAAEYAISVVNADFEEAGIEDVVRKVAADLAGHASADDVRAKMAELLPVAKAQLMTEL